MITTITNLLHHPGVRRYTHNLSWLLFAKIFTLAVSFLTTLYIARVLGPTNFGELDYALAIIGVLAPLATLGISNVLQRELIKYPGERNALIGTACTLQIIFALLATLLVNIYAFLSRVDSVSQVLIIILSGTYVLGVFQLLQQEFYARAESKIPSLITMGVWLIVSVCKVIVLVLGKGVIWLAAISVLEQVFYAIPIVIAYRLYGYDSLWKIHFSSRYVPLFLKTGSAMALAAFFTLIYARIDQIFIRHMIDAHAVGLYSAGVRLVDLWNIVPALLLGGLYPALVNSKTSSEATYRTRMRYVLWALTITGFFLACIISLVSPVLLKIIFGTDFILGASSLRVYAWSIVGTFLGIYVMNILFTEDHRKVLIVTNVVPAIINIGFNLWLIPLYGIIGAAYATVIAYSITPLVPLCFRSSRKKILEIFY